MLTTLRANRYYRPLLWAAFGLCLLMAAWRGSAIITNANWIASDDFLGYWAAGQLHWQGENPYDAAKLLELQQAAGWPGEDPVILWSPPWTLPLIMTLGAFSYPASRTAWLLLNIGIMILSVDLLWRLYGGPRRLRWASWLLGFSFIPVLDALKKGQSGILILLGIAGFLFFVEKKKPWLAGACLGLLAIKPHVAYLFFLAALLWSLQRRAWAVIGGLAVALGSSTLLVWAANPPVFTQYLHAVASYPPSGWATPTLGGILRLVFGAEYFWLQFLPAAFGVIWLLVYWTPRRKNWDWLVQGPLVILVSLATTAYGWSFDQPAALVAVIQIFVMLAILPWDKASAFIVVAYVLINLLDLAAPGNEVFLFWLAPTVLLWYLGSRWAIKNQFGVMWVARGSGGGA